MRLRSSLVSPSGSLLPKQRALAPAGAWRGGAATPVGRAVRNIEKRLAVLEASDRWTPLLRGHSVRESLRTHILDNELVSNEQVLALQDVKLGQLASTDTVKNRVAWRVPDARRLDSHHFSVAFLSALTGVDAEALSEAAPDLGLLGSATLSSFTFSRPSESLARSTALHDASDWLSAVVPGINQAFWGTEDSTLSAAVSAFEGLSGRT